jgi:hypothetical protein
MRGGGEGIDIGVGRKGVELCTKHKMGDYDGVALQTVFDLRIPKKI